MKKLILLMTVVFTTVNFIHAQIVGTPNANIAFSTNPQAKLLAHVQSNNSSDLGNFSKQWIGIGQPLNGLYGFRSQ